MSQHPEQREGELYLGNTTEHGFHGSAWMSKRMGKDAQYKGQRDRRFDDYRPWFILASEVEDRIRAEEAAQGPNWTEKVRTYRQMIEDRS